MSVSIELKIILLNTKKHHIGGFVNDTINIKSGSIFIKNQPEKYLKPLKRKRNSRPKPKRLDYDWNRSEKFQNLWQKHEMTHGMQNLVQLSNF